ncbi:S8 family serine peptidase [Candidatus Gottesmanbacteria bacterium]|nr:S8 family serine peptidase [Candidatus Gottesmanbacteria bacterium]
MKIACRLLILLFFLFSFLFATPLLVYAQVRPAYVEGEMIVKLKDTGFLDEKFLKKFDLATAENVIPRRLKIQKLNEDRQGLDRIFKVRLKNKFKFNQILSLLRKEGMVEYVEPNYILSTFVTPNDPDFSKLWGLNNTGQTGGTSGADIKAINAWDNIHDSNLVVGIIDTGVDYTHEDLANNMWKNPGEVEGNGVDDDGNGYVDDVYGWDFVNNDNNPMDDHGHGTHVAGTIGGEGNNSIGVSGINWEVKIAALKFLSSGGYGTTTDAIEAISYANSMGFKITNNSWGGGGYSQALYDAIAAANNGGYLFVAAAGNSGLNTDNSSAYPASYNLDNIISVAATDHNDNIASFSNYGVNSVDLGAPGVNIYSSVPKGNCSLCAASGYTYLSGTSMATPHVAGAAALIWTSKPALSHLQIKSLLLSTTDPLSSLSGKSVSGGRLNIWNPFENDTTAPSAVTTLSVSDKNHNSVVLSWIATGDDGNTGSASSYDLRYSLNNVTEANFNSAIKVSGLPKPKQAGSQESFKVTGLTNQTTYYFAIKVIDNLGNTSSVSNVVFTTTSGVASIINDTVEDNTYTWTVTGNNGLGGSALWHKSTRRSQSPTKSWYYGQESSGNYDTGYRNYGYLTSQPLNLSNVNNPELVFSYFLSKESSTYYDRANVEISTNGGSSWTSLKTLVATNNTFIKETLDLSAFTNQTILIRFYFDTLDSILNMFEGWYVDDIIIQATSSGPIPTNTPSPTLTPTPTPSPTLTPSPTPTPTSAPIQVFSDSFELSEWNGLWSEDSQNDWFRSRQRRQGTGRYSAEVDGSASDAQLISNLINLQGKTNATIEFYWFIESGLDLGEYIAFDVSTDGGTNWAEKARIKGNEDTENTWKFVSINLNNISQLRLRFRGKMSLSSEDADVDVVSVKAF